MSCTEFLDKDSENCSTINFLIVSATKILVLIVVGELHYSQCHIRTHVFVASRFKNVDLKLIRIAA